MKELPSKFNDRFRTMEVLAQRRGNRVLKCWDQVLERPVVVKCLEPLNESEVRSLERFLREAQALARLSHPGVVRVYDFDYSKQLNQYYLILEFVEGPTLADEIKSQSGSDLRGRIEFLEKIVKNLGPTLLYVHKRGIIHRDLKPQNIIVRKPFSPVLVDFGISLDVRKHRITRPGSLVGTPLYLAPEQVADDIELDQRVDIYAVGLILFEIVCGKTAYMHEDPIRLIIKQMEDPVPNLSDHGISHLRGINAVLAKAMAKDRDNRFDTIAEFFEALLSAIEEASQPTSSSEYSQNLETISPSRPQMSKELAHRDYLVLVDSRSARIDQSLFMLEHLVENLTPYDDDGLDIIFSGHHIDILSRLAESKSTLEVEGQSPWGFVTLPTAIERIMDIYVENVKSDKYGPEGKSGFSAIVVMDEHLPQSEIFETCSLLRKNLPDLPLSEKFFISFLTGDFTQHRGNELLEALANEFPKHVSTRKDQGDRVSLELGPPDPTG
jgi:serine/threonine protein kinase